jgi:two-component system response regulator AtoC
VKVLIVDDEKNIRDSIIRYLKLERIEAEGAENGLAAQRKLGESAYGAAVVDLRMPGMDGLALLRWIQEEGPAIPVIMISAYGEIRDAVEAMKRGARDYIVKPFDPQELILRLERIREEQKLAEQVQAARAAGPASADWVVHSPAMQEVAALVAKVAPTPSTVLITGESGTGKEVVAREIHRLSRAADGPFVPINIGGLPETLLESELFGYERGAFTGAERRKPGMLELANGGTLFLDEIGDMPPALQVKLLRVLQERQIQRLGGTQRIPVDARILAATHRDLPQRIREGRFREDLYYRLNVIRIAVPPLRERPQDIPLLVGRIIARLNRTMGRQLEGADPEALERLAAYPFPGNVRELENIIERAFILSDGTRIRADALGPEFSARRPARRAVTGRGSIRDVEREALAAALARWEGNRTQAARELGISRRTLFNKIKQYGLDQAPR